MQVDSLMDKTFNSIIPAITQQMNSQVKDANALAKSEKVFKIAMDAGKDIMKKMMDTDMVDIYDKYFTEQEINDFTAFYKTPAGQKMLKVLPEIQKEIMTLMMQKYMPEMQSKIKEAVEKLEPAKPVTPAKPASPVQKPANSGKKKS